MEDYKKIAEKLRYTKSESKRKLLDEAADTIERLEAERNELAIAVLREQVERSKGCEYCQRFDDPCGVPMIATEEDDCDRGIYLYNGYLCANGGSFCSAKVQFCPMCGRKLEVEG